MIITVVKAWGEYSMLSGNYGGVNYHNLVVVAYSYSILQYYWWLHNNNELTIASLCFESLRSNKYIDKNISGKNSQLSNL